MIRQSNNAPFSQRQLRVGELIKQSLGQIFLRDEAKVPLIETKNITRFSASEAVKKLPVSMYVKTW